MSIKNLGKVVGDSAYEIAVKNGFSGTEAEWLDSLKGTIDEAQLEEIKQDCVNEVLAEGFIKNDTTALTNYYTEEEIDGLLDTIQSTTVSSVTATDKSINISGVSTNPSVSLNIDNTATRGNVEFTVTENGISATVDASKFEAIVVSALPVEGIQSTYYLVPTADVNVYTKYLWVKNIDDTYSFLSLGTTEINLSSYATKTELTSGLNTKIDNSVLPTLATKVYAESLIPDSLPADGGNSDTVNGYSIQPITEEEYNLITPDPNTFYFFI